MSDESDSGILRSVAERTVRIEERLNGHLRYHEEIKWLIGLWVPMLTAVVAAGASLVFSRLFGG